MKLSPPKIPVTYAGLRKRKTGKTYLEIMTKGKEYRVMCNQEIIDKLSDWELLKGTSGPRALSYEQRIINITF